MAAVMPFSSGGPDSAPKSARKSVPITAPITAPIAAAKRPPKAPPPRKAGSAAECAQLEQLPNIGPSIAGDLRRIGIARPEQMVEQDPFHLYQALCRATGKRHDPCVLDTFMAACDFMRGSVAKPWWQYTALRKAQYGPV